ncbi:hypothetical protein GCM10020367_20730 [Streptomyces sannanensis]|uniref:Uncharacterized protein n=1 Tax=Streptomyces sannanensis TaxID=285536 RepID=A0ABP6S913_9ACTN
MRIAKQADGRPLAAVTGWDLKIFTDALRVYVETGGAPRRATVLLAALDGIASVNRVEPCICGSSDHHFADCAKRTSRRHLRLL